MDRRKEVKRGEKVTPFERDHAFLAIRANLRREVQLLIDKNGSGQGAIQEALYCMCRKVSYGEMVCCDNDDCVLQWYHFHCVGLETKPRGKWYCDPCKEAKTPAAGAAAAATTTAPTATTAAAKAAKE